MKKIFTLIMATMLAACTYAQVNFVDAEDNVCGDGSTMQMYDEFPEEEDFISIANPKLTNTTNAAVKVQIEVNIISLPEGTQLSDCFSGMCTSYSELGSHMTGERTIAANTTIPTMIEWNCFDTKKGDYVKGTCVVKMTLYVNGNKAQTVTIRYINGDDTAVSSITATEKPHTTYTIDGKVATKEAKGLLIRGGKKFIVR